MRVDAAGLPITLDVEGWDVLVVGDDADATKKRALCEAAGARVTQVAAGAFDEAAVGGRRLVLLSARDAALAARVSAAARAAGALVWCSDDPGRSDFAMPAIAQLGPARIAVATSGGSPSLAARLRAALEAQLGTRFAAFATALAGRRKQQTIDERKADLDGFDLKIEITYPDWFDGPST
jgi:precorrin-2 dehydrogenase / sirohydrochlorin ferrochelatase